MDTREDTDGLVEVEDGPGECPREQSALAKTREWRVWLRNGWVLRETLAIFKIAAPMVANNFFYQVMFTVALVFVGNSSGRSLELDAAALALSFMNVTGVSVGIGLATAAETLCAQMFGFKNYKGLGLVTQRGIWILGLALFPIFIIWFNTESLLLLMQQDPCVARLTAVYVKIFATALPALFLFVILQRYLVAQSIVLLFITIGVFNNVVSAALHGILIYWIGMGIEGSSISLALATITSSLILLLFIRLRKSPNQTWGGWSLDGLRGWGQFIRLGVPGLLMICFEWWSFEIAAFVTGTISNTQLAIYTIVLQILSLNFMLPYGVSMAVTVRVGNELGAGNPQRAKQATYTAFGIILVQSALVMVFLATTRNVLGWIFTRDQDVIEGVGEVILAIIPLLLTDSLQGMMQGVLRGTGKQLSGALINFVSYYIIGLPMGATLAIIAGMGALGMWVGLLVGSVTQATCYIVLVIILKWDKESLEAIKRAQSASVSTDASSSSDTQSVGSSVSTAMEDVEGERERDRERMVFRDFTAGNGLESEKAHSGMLVEELPLISMDEEKELASTEQDPEFLSQATVSNGRSHNISNMTFLRDLHERSSGASGWIKWSPKSRLVLSRLALLVVGVALLVLGGLAGQYRPHRPLSEYCPCTDMSGNGTEVRACWNETANPQDPVSWTATLSPNSSATVRYPGSTHLMYPTSTPLV